MLKLPTILRALVAAELTLLGACTPVREAVRCRRVETASMGPENGLSTRADAPPTNVIDEADERIDLTIAALPPGSGPVTLVQTVEGHEPLRWNITMPASDGSVHRCSIGLTPTGSTCGVTIPGGALPVAGRWTIEANGNRVIEASVAFRLCD